jgi:hypothetical protein
MVAQELLDRILALSHQEDFYQCKDYLKLRKDVTKKQAVDETCRYTMANWCYQVLDYCDASEEIGSIAISYVDRFLSSKQGSFVLNDKKYFQLLVMCSLQLAIKLHESRTLESDTLSKLSRGLFSVKDISLMEKALLTALSWRLCPATPYVILDVFIDLLPPTMSDTTKSSLLKLSKKQIHLALPQYYFSQIKSSAIAFASLLNSMEEIFLRTEEIQELRRSVASVGLKFLDESFMDVRIELYALLNPRSSKLLNASCSRSNKTCVRQSASARVRQACQ